MRYAFKRKKTGKEAEEWTAKHGGLPITSDAIVESNHLTFDGLTYIHAYREGIEIVYQQVTYGRS